MDRHVLFRAKCLFGAKWVKGDLYHRDKSSPVIRDSKGQEYEVSTNTVCMCTGLKDSAKKLVFEGDICRYKWNPDPVTVVWSDGAFWISGQDRKLIQPLHDIMSGDMWNDGITVIGNIYDKK